ncbi:MAG: hypothetical protein C4529_13940 [Deltaproteobacteria bacterium]|nr:MAG: hypothetical protein C4529_13940 [Deltaproteobacteria bacterium]
MPEPIRERILADLSGAASGVTKDAGYGLDMRTVARSRREPFQNHEYPATNIFEGPEKKQDGPTALTTCFLSVFLEISVWDGTALAVAANLAMASVVKAVLADRTRGGLAIDTEEVGNKMFLDETDPNRPIGGFRVELSIEYRHAENDPFSAN